MACHAWGFKPGWEEGKWEAVLSAPPPRGCYGDRWCKIQFSVVSQPVKGCCEMTSKLTQVDYLKKSSRRAHRWPVTGITLMAHLKVNVNLWWAVEGPPPPKQSCFPAQLTPILDNYLKSLPPATELPSPHWQTTLPPPPAGKPFHTQPSLLWESSAGPRLFLRVPSLCLSFPVAFQLLESPASLKKATPTSHHHHHHHHSLSSIPSQETRPHPQKQPSPTPRS